MNITLIERLWKRTSIENSCWIYLGTSFISAPNNYGMLWLDNQDHHVHRLSLCIYLKLDYNDKSWMACHICKNKRCWNPLHLYQGTNKENQLDVVKEGYHKGVNKICCKNGHLYTPENTYNHPTSGRQCIRCRQLNRRKYFERYKQ